MFRLQRLSLERLDPMPAVIVPHFPTFPHLFINSSEMRGPCSHVLYISNVNVQYNNVHILT